jgi:hypothetical protein
MASVVIKSYNALLMIQRAIQNCGRGSLGIRTTGVNSGTGSWRMCVKCKDNTGGVNLRQRRRYNEQFQEFAMLRSA